MQIRELIVPSDESGNRLDLILTRAYPDLSRSFLQRLIQAGLISVGGRIARASHRPRAGDSVVVQIPPPSPTELVPTPMPLTVVYEDQDLLVVDKPAGLVVHPAPGHASDTLVNALVARYPHLNVGNALRPGIVHRLDKDTSGLMVIAKHDSGLRNLVDQMKCRAVRKDYLALVHGHITEDRGLIEAPIGRHPRARQRMAVVDGGRAARTWFQVLERLRHYTLVEARLETGRTHQIRVHFASLKHPVAGDRLYGPDQVELPLQRQFLHACRLGFALPSTGRSVLFESPLHEDLSLALTAAR